MSEDLTKCPQCGGEADNGIDRCIPPSAYMCSKCCAQEEAERQAALQESEAGAVYQVEQIIGGVSYWLDVSKQLYDCETLCKKRTVLTAHPSAQAIETAAIMRAAEVVRSLGEVKDSAYVEAFLALITQDGRTQLEQKCMEVAEEVKSATVFNECRNMLTKENELRAIVTNLIGEKK